MARVTRLGHLPLTMLIVVAIAVEGCGSGAPPTANCDKWCGSGSATVTFAGTTETISGGGCFDSGPAGIEARFGDWQGINGVSGYLTLAVYRPGGPTPAPGPTLAPDVAPTGPASPTVDGSVNGHPFVLAPGAVVGITPDDTGSFSGTDVNGGGTASGTFSCR